MHLSCLHWVTLSLLLLSCGQSASIDQPDPYWAYFLAKYARASGESLSSAEVQKIVENNVEPRSKSGVSLGNEAACEVVGFPNVTLRQGDWDLACPRLLYLIDNPGCWARKGEPEGQFLKAEDQGSVEVKKKPRTAEVWGYGFLFVTLISLSSLAGVSVMPFMGKKLYKNILTMLIGLAVGSLVGSSLFHLIPQAFGLIDPDAHHHYLYTSLVICGGIWMFFMVERFLKIIMEYKDRKDRTWKREKISSIYSSTPENSTISMLVENGLDKNGTGERMNGSIISQASAGVIYESQEQAIKASFGHQDKPKCSNGHEHVKFEQGKDSVIATVAWMIIFGDGLHNFIDGLSIGAAFNESILTGVSISVAVLCEELPHELGDFAVLLNAGMSVRQAMMYNFMSACTCYLGMAVGIFLGQGQASEYIFALAGGMFLYISLVDMVPEMNEVATESSKVSVWRALRILVLQNVGIFIGITALFVLAMYQDNIQF